MNEQERARYIECEITGDIGGDREEDDQDEGEHEDGREGGEDDQEGGEDDEEGDGRII